MILVLASATLVGCARGNPPEAAPAAPAAAPAAPTSLPQPQPVSDIVHQTTFAPSLGIDLSRMLRHPSGLYVQDLATGTGAVAFRGKTLVVRYTGWLADGTEFDSGEITVTLGGKGVIPGWEEGLLGMRVGGRRRLIVPPELGYGAAGQGKIPPNAVLVFDMELTGIE
ncbi:MAG TPA: FKBP-type peptidyl-prolyl cis-trans isomerase [Gemmatimonadaceae bacterium]|nr:FKBP-type peptidyl-prolyl cis-trans isomerase [Gemmatimonadaceae bacterium]